MGEATIGKIPVGFHVGVMSTLTGVVTPKTHIQKKHVQSSTNLNQGFNPK
jgi:hypothetical protein